MAALRSRCRHIFVLCFLLLLSSALFPHPSPNLSGSRVNVYQISTHGVLSANLGCRSEMCYSWLAGNTGSKNSPSAHHRTTLSGCIFATKARIDNRQKTCSTAIGLSPPRLHNMANFGPLAAEIGSGVWGTPANFKGFRVLAALLHSTLVVGVSQTLRC